MILSDLVSYLHAHHRASLIDMANRFDIDPQALRPMLTILEHKGRVRRLHGGVSCSCNKASCNQTMPEWYEAVARRPGGDRNRPPPTCAAISPPGPARLSSSES